MKPAQWNLGLKRTDYDQGWSMVHYLVHAENGKFQESFANYVNDIAAGKPWSFAFTRYFGQKTEDFQERYSNWWLSLKENPSREKYEKAVVKTLLSFLGRLVTEGNCYENYEEFQNAAKNPALQLPEDKFLPPELLLEALEESVGLGDWSLEGKGKDTKLTLTTRSGKKYVGSFSVELNNCLKTDVKVYESNFPARTTPIGR